MEPGVFHPRLTFMSRAFVNDDIFAGDIPDRPVSEHPN